MSGGVLTDEQVRTIKRLEEIAEIIIKSTDYKELTDLSVEVYGLSSIAKQIGYAVDIIALQYEIIEKLHELGYE
jgi:hypothetical protein